MTLLLILNLPFKFSFCGLHFHAHILAKVIFEWYTVYISAPLTFSYRSDVKHYEQYNVEHDDEDYTSHFYDQFTFSILWSECHIWNKSEGEQNAEHKSKHVGVVIDPRQQT